MIPNYRYRLSRNITSPSSRVLLVCMLNPSTADDQKDDQTISRVCCLAENGGFSRLLVLNLLGIRATKRADIWLHQDPVGVENWRTWDDVLKELNPDQDSISVAWGCAPRSRRQLLRFIPVLVEASRHLKVWQKPLMTWVKNRDGSPRHPLYIPAQTKLQHYDLDSYVSNLLQQNPEL